MLGSFSTRQKGVPVLVADIESGSAGAAIVFVHTGGAARVLASERAMLSIEERISNHRVRAAVKLMGEIAAHVAGKYNASDSAKKYGHVQKMCAIVGAPFCRSRSVSAEEYFKEDEMVTEHMIEALAQRALAEASALDKENILETNVTRVQLNGYATAHPLGKNARSIMVSAYQSDINPQVKEGIEHALQALFPGRPLSIRSRLRTILTTLHERTDARHYTVISMGSDETQCIAVRKDQLAGHISIPEGVTTLLRRAAGEKGLPEEMLSLLKMVTSDACSSAACEEVKNSFGRIEPELVSIFGESFAKLSGTRHLPNICFLLVHADMAPWLEHFFARIDFAPFTVTTQPFSVESLSPEHLHELVEWEPGLREDTHIAIAAAFVNSIH